MAFSLFRKSRRECIPEATGYGSRKGMTSSGTRRVFYFIGLFSVFGWLYVFFVSDLFSIDQIDVTGLKSLDAVDVNREVYALLDQRRGWRPWSTRQIWFIDEKKLADELKTQLFAENVTVDKKSTHILRLIVEERTSKLIFHSHKQYVWVDLQGLVTSELTKVERQTVQSRLLGQRLPNPLEPPVVHKDLDELIAVGYRVAESSQVKSWIQITSEIMDNGIPYREFNIPDNDKNTAAIVSPDGYPVYVDIEKPLEPQLKTYKAFKEARTNFKVSEYLDVRIPGRIYYK